MFNFGIIKIFLFCFYLKIHIKSQLYPYYHEANFEVDDRETSVFSIGTDFGPCPCDLHRGLCDFNCCCDEDCDDVQIKKFSFECDKYYHQKFINDKFKCQNIKKTFDYYKYRPHENNVYSYKNNEDLNKYNDQIFGLMCMVYDRTGDIGEFNIEFDGNKENELNRKHEKYNEYFNSRIEKEKTIYIRQEQTDNSDIKQIHIYKSDAFGNCIKTLQALYINSSKPIENIECGMNIDKIQDQNNYIIDLLDEYQTNCICDNCFILSNNKINTKINDCNEYRDKLSTHVIKEFHITFKLNKVENKDNVFDIQDLIIKSLITDSTNLKRIKQKFSVNFVSSDYDTQNPKFKSGLPGYLINKPVLFKENRDATQVLVGIQIQGANPIDGKCLNQNNDIVNVNDPFILFKVDTIYTCKLEDVNMNSEINVYKIFTNIESGNVIGKYGFASYKVNNKNYINDWIDFNENNIKDNKDECENYIKGLNNYKCLRITQFLEIIFSKFGKKGSSQEYIYDVKLFNKYEPIEFDFEDPYNDYKNIELKFIVKFISLNEEQFQRNFENDNYKTSLIPLPEDVKYPKND